MSALSKSNGPSKKGGKPESISINDIANSTGIAIGRGYEDHVAMKSIQQESAAPAVHLNHDEMPTEAELDQIINNSPLPTETKNETRETLHEGLLAELNKGDQANIIVIKQQLTRIASTIPDIRNPLRLFIENQIGVSKTIKFLTNKLLT